MIDKKKCAKWCGAGCTVAQYEKARRLSVHAAVALGAGWRPRPFENMGWHGVAVSKCGRIKVHIHTALLGPPNYTAFFGEKGPGGRWVASSKTPRAAVRKVIAQAKADLARIQAALTGLPEVPGA
jgi:hypothetical protein